MRKVGVIILVGIVLLVLLFGVGVVRRSNSDSSFATSSSNVSVGESASLSPGDYEFFVTSQDRSRRYLAHVPSSYRGEPIDVIINFHGGGGSAAGHESLSRLSETADRDRFIAVYPEGTREDGGRGAFNRFWNVPGGPTGDYNSPDSYLSTVDEIAFAQAIIADLEERLVLRNIYTAGFSNGAIAAQYVACQISDVSGTAAIGAPYWHSPTDCPYAVPAIIFHGKADECAPYEGGLSGCESGITNSRRVFPSAEDGLLAWKELNGCSDSSDIVYQQGAVTCTTYSCTKGAVEFCTIDDGGHTWPGGKPYSLPGVPIGKTSQDISANEEMWKFFTSSAI